MSIFHVLESSVIPRADAAGMIGAFLRGPASPCLSDDIAHKLLIIRKYIARDTSSGATKAEENCFQKRSVLCRIGVPPASLTDVATAIRKTLSNYVLGVHNMEFMGVLLAFSDFIVPEVTPLKWDLNHTFVNFTINMLVFDPAHSDQLYGQVTKVADDHIPLLVFGIFNASVPKTEDEAPSVGSEVVFRVKGLDAQAVPIMILGKLGAKKAKKSDKKDKAHKRNREEAEETQETEAAAAEEPSKPEKKRDKKEKKKKAEEEASQ